MQLQGHKALQLRAVLFDMDGVLFNSMPFHARAWSKVMTDAGFKFSEEDVYMNEGRTGADTINTASLAQFGKPATQELIDTLCKAKCNIFDTYPTTPRMQGALELVKKVKDSGLTPMIVTGSGTPTLLGRIQENFPALFNENHIVTSFNVKRGKPYPDPYLLALEKGGFAPNEAVDIVVRPEDVDIVPVEKGMLKGKITQLTFKGDYYEIIVDIGGFKWMIQATDYVEPDSVIGLYIEPDAIHVMKKSEYSDMFGDYSSFSDELDHLSDTEEESEDE